jgi:hypothetical protein
MSTILKSGKRRCDAVCHSAKGVKCGCICCGKFHGASINVSKTAERAELEDIVLTKAMKAVAELSDNNDQQPSFFTDEDLDAAYSELKGQ